MSRFIKILLLLNLAVILVLAVVYPSLMISPGPVIKGHEEFSTDCFACHTPLLGARSEKCISCHKVTDIGLLTTKGKPVVKNKPATAFHQKLLGQDCVACHSDHEGVIVFREVQKFSHALVDEKTLKQCVACHKIPTDMLHKSAPEDCKMCHTTDKWKPATFKHDFLPKERLANCKSCHLEKTPKDRVHDNASKDCKVCHTTDKWKPATFKHELLPKAELRVCENCHIKKAPDDRLHRESTKRCKNCHTTDKWKPAKNIFGKSRSQNPVSSSSPFDAVSPGWWRDRSGND